MEIEVPIEGETVLPREEAASFMSSFWERAYTEFNSAKAFRAAESVPESTMSEDVDAFRALAEDTGPRIKLGRKVERERPSPQSLSSSAMRHCLLGGLPHVTPNQDHDCWAELDHILTACGRQTEGVPTVSRDAVSPGLAQDQSQRRAAARHAFVACLAELVNMHGHHRPFPLGPPAKDQACCAVDQEHSTVE